MTDSRTPEEIAADTADVAYANGGGHWHRSRLIAAIAAAIRAERADLELALKDNARLAIESATTIRAERERGDRLQKALADVTGVASRERAIEAAAIVLLGHCDDDGDAEGDWASKFMAACKDEPHEGDCPFVERPWAITCNRCVCDRRKLIARQMIDAYERALAEAK